MAIFTQIELFKLVDVADTRHQVALTNSSFTLVNSPLKEWYNRSGEWQWTAGTGSACYTDGGLHQPLAQQFPNPMLPETWYHVGFTVTGMTQGSLDVYMGSFDRIITITGDGVYNVSYWTSSGSSVASFIAFYPSNLGVVAGLFFDGCLRDVSIISDPILSKNKEQDWEPVGMLDMKSDERLGITYRVSDVKSLSKRFGGFSKVFSLPATGNNKQLLSHLHSNEAQPRVYDPRNKSKAVLWADDVPVLRGFMSLKNVTTQGDESWFELELFDSTFGLLDSIRGKKLSNLDLSRYAHTLTRDNIVASWQSGWTWMNGYTYPLYLNADDRFRVKDDFRPAFFNRMLLHELISQASYTYDLSPQLEAELNLVLTAPVGKKPSADEMDFIRNQAIVSSNLNQTISVPVGIAGDGSSSIPLSEVRTQWQTNVENEDFGSNYNNGSLAWYYVAPFEGDYTISFTASCQVTLTEYGEMDNVIPFPHPLVNAGSEADAVFFQAFDFVTGAAIGSPSNGWDPPSSYNGPVTTNEIFSGTVTAPLLAGQQVTIKAVVANKAMYRFGIPIPLGGTQYIHYRPSVIVSMIDSGSTAVYRMTDGAYSVTEGMLVNPSDWLGSIGQEQYLSDLIRAWNLMVLPDRDNEKLIHISTRNEFYDNADIIDRSGQVALDENIVREYLTEISSSEIILGYKAPIQKDTFNQAYTDITAEQYGDHEFQYNTDIYVDSSEVRLASYTPCPIVIDNGGRYVPAVLSRSQEADCKMLIRSEETLPTEVKLSWFSELSNSYSTNVYSYYRPTLHIDSVTGSTFDINFGEVELSLTNADLNITANNLFQAHYSEQLSQWRDGRLFTVLMNLSVADVLEHLDKIGARIFVEELGNWFTLVAIIDWDPSLGDQSLTKVQLLEAPPSDRAITTRRLITLKPVVKTPSILGTLGGEITDAEITGREPGLFNSNTGFNQLNELGHYNQVVGSGNTLNKNASYNTVFGANNAIGAEVSGVTILGGSGIVANQSDSVFLSDHAVVAPTGSTFYGSAATITQGYTAFYGTGLTITPDRTSFYGSAVTITSGGIKINGQDLNGLPTGTTHQMLYHTGGTWTVRDMQLRASYVPSTGWVQLGDPSNTVGTSAIYVASIGGAVNNIDSTSLLATSVGGAGNVIVGDSQGSFSLGGFFNQINGPSSVKYSGLIGGTANYITSGSQYSIIIAGTENQMSDSIGSVMIGCSGLTVSGNYTTYLNTVSVQHTMDLKPLTSTPNPKEGRLYFSANTGLFVCTGSTSADWKRVSLV